MRVKKQRKKWEEKQVFYLSLMLPPLLSADSKEYFTPENSAAGKAEEMKTDKESLGKSNAPVSSSEKV